MSYGAAGKFEDSGVSAMFESANGIENVVGVYSYPITALPKTECIHFYGTTTPVGDSDYDFATIGSRFDLLTVVSGAVTAFQQFVKTGAAEWSAIGALPVVVADPGDAAAIPVIYDDAHIAITTAAAETNTLAIPTKVGQKLTLYVDTYAVGDRVITVAAAVNVANNNTLTFGVASDFIKLEAITLAGALVWQITSNDGVALSTV